MIIVMKVVGINLIKLFRNFKFEKSAVILTSYMAIAGSAAPATFFVDFDIKNVYVPLKIASGQNIVVWA